MTIAPTPGAAPPRAERIQRLAFVVLIAVLALRALLLPVLAWNSRYVMDEYTQAAFPLYIPMGFYDGLDPIKTVLYVYVFEAAHCLTRHAVDLLHLARMEGTLLAFLAAGATFGIARRLGRSRFEAWFSRSRASGASLSAARSRGSAHMPAASRVRFWRTECGSTSGIRSGCSRWCS